MQKKGRKGANERRRSPNPIDGSVGWDLSDRLDGLSYTHATLPKNFPLSPLLDVKVIVTPEPQFPLIVTVVGRICGDTQPVAAAVEKAQNKMPEEKTVGSD
jgi:hypothetical protein